MSSDAEALGELSIRSGLAEVRWTIKIEQLLSQRRESKEEVCFIEEVKEFFSPEFYVGGSKWKLGVCPNYVENGETWIFLGLYAAEGSDRPKSVDFTLILKKLDGTVLVEDNFAHIFLEENTGHGRILLQKSKLASQEDLSVTCRMYVNEELNSTTRLDKLSQDLRNLLIFKRNCDVTLNVNGTKVMAHRLILEARCPALAKLLPPKRMPFRQEEDTGDIDIENCDPKNFQEFLLYLYSGGVENLSEEKVFQLCLLAHIFKVPQLKEACFSYVLHILSIDNVLKAFRLADELGEAYRKEKIQKFFNENYDEIRATSKWISFLEKRTKLADELLKNMKEHKENEKKNNLYPTVESSV